jgi:cytosine/adenosine deaminase-related metal-dependent hydrolase
VILHGARVAKSAAEFEHRDVEIEGRGELDLRGYAILPGLINAHDHLEFNLFPRLGRGPWPNASEWARAVYRPDESPVREHRRVPRRVRLYWGALKNLVSGVTTVCHHNPYEPSVFGPRFPVRVVREFAWAHSLAFSPDIRERFRSAPRRWPFIIHAAEAADGSGRAELRELNRMGVLTKRTVVIHAVDADWKLLRTRGVSVIACPGSNVASLGRTIRFDPRVPIALGTDSAITAQGDLLDELRFSARVCHLKAARLYEMVTSVPRTILRLPSTDDFIVVKDRGTCPADTLLATKRIAMSIVDGRIRLAHPRWAPARFHPLAIQGRGRLMVDADTAALYRAAVEHVGEPLRLAGKRVRV